MAKVQIKSEKITPFGGIFHVRELFSRFVGPVIDKVSHKLTNSQTHKMKIQTHKGDSIILFNILYIL